MRVSTKSGFPPHFINCLIITDADCQKPLASPYKPVMNGMKSSFRLLFIVALLIASAHRLPAPIQEVPESPTPSPTAAPTSTPKPAAPEPTEARSKPAKSKPKQTESEAPKKNAPPPAKTAPVAGTWNGHWTNSRGESGGVTITLAEGPGGAITGNPGMSKIDNGHRSGNVVTYTFHRWGRDYAVTLNLSADGTTMTGEYKVTQGPTLIYTGKYDNFKRR